MCAKIFIEYQTSRYNISNFLLQSLYTSLQIQTPGLWYYVAYLNVSNPIGQFHLPWGSITPVEWGHVEDQPQYQIVTIESISSFTSYQWFANISGIDLDGVSTSLTIHTFVSISALTLHWNGQGIGSLYHQLILLWIW